MAIHENSIEDFSIIWKTILGRILQQRSNLSQSTSATIPQHYQIPSRVRISLYFIYVTRSGGTGTNPVLMLSTSLLLEGRQCSQKLGFCLTSPVTGGRVSPGNQLSACLKVFLAKALQLTWVYSVAELTYCDIWLYLCLSKLIAAVFPLVMNDLVCTIEQIILN